MSMKAEDLVNRYLIDRSANGVEEGTVNQNKDVLSRFLLSMKNHNHTEINVESVSDWKQDLILSNTKVTTLRLYLGILKVMCDWAIDLEVMDRNPVKKSLMPSSKAVMKVKNQEYEKQITFEQYKKLTSVKSVHHMSKEVFVYTKNAIIVLGTTGLRNSEFRSLRLSDINFDNHTLLVRHGKGDKKRTVPMLDATENAIKYFMEHSGHTYKPNDVIFGVGENWEEIDRTALSARVNDYCKKVINFDYRIGTHAFRHFCGCLLLTNGVNISDISKNFGHSSSVITEQVYAHDMNKYGNIDRTINIMNNVLV